MPGQEYLELLPGRAADLYARGQLTARTDTIATLWDISLEPISGESPAAVQLLDVCAYLAPEPVPLALFTAHPAELPEPLSSAAADQLAFSDTIAVLVDYSLAKRTPAGLQLTPRRHPPGQPRLGPAGRGTAAGARALQTVHDPAILSITGSWTAQAGRATRRGPAEAPTAVGVVRQPA